jgi:hypothetical protein
LSTLKYPVIFEGDFLEYDTALNWLKQESGIQEVPTIFYGKLSYDYGFFDFFSFPQLVLKQKSHCNQWLINYY